MPLLAYPKLARATFLALSLAGLLTAAPVKFDIPAQPLAPALQLFMKQSGTEVAFPPDDLKNTTANALAGEYEPRTALDTLLKGTGFTATERKSGWFAVVRADSQKPGSIEGQVRDESGKPVPNARVSVAGSELGVLTDRRGRFLLEHVPAGAQAISIFAEGMQKTRVTDVAVRPGHRHTLSVISIPAAVAGITQLEDYVVSAKKNDGVVELDPYAVEGFRERPFGTNMDIPRTINDAQPYYIFGNEQIDRSGAINVEEFLKQRLTMNTVALTNRQDTGEFANLGNTSSINLRGLGADKTLVLVNGRRMAGVVIRSADMQPDLNGIPISAIDRIEVLPSSASGIYGGGAIGGVVNIVLKKDYTGGEIRATYDNTFDTDAPIRSVSANYGLALEGGKTRVQFHASWSDAKPLILAERRDVYAESLATLMANAPSFIYEATNPFLGALPNITRSLDTQTDLTLKNGVFLPTRNTHVGAGISPGSSPAELYSSLAANAGRWNMDLPLSTQAPTGLLRPLGATPEATAFGGSVRRQMLPNLEVFASFSLARNRTESVFSPFSTYFTIPVGSPVNPFITSNRVRVPDATEFASDTQSDVRSGTIGASAHLPADWLVELDYTWSQSRFDYISSTRDFLAQNADIASGAINPYVDTLRFPLNLQKYVAPISYSGSSELDDIALRGTGPFWSLPTGTPRLTVGLEQRIARSGDNVTDTQYPVSRSDSTRLTYFGRKQTTASGYGEFILPVVAADRLPLIHTLDIQVSGRVERYTVDSGTPYLLEFPHNAARNSYGLPNLDGQRFQSEASYTSSNFTTGFKYQPRSGITVRASLATAFLPPTPDQLIKDPRQSNSTTTVVDPLNGREVEVFTIGGGNPDLDPQNSRSLNVGMIWEPKTGPMQGARINVEYYITTYF